MSGLARPVAGIGAVAVAAAGYLAAFPDRSDYAGHFLAGAGGTLLLLAPALLAVRRLLPWAVVGLTALAVLLGVGTEATVFKLAEFDPVDLANQSLGGILAAAGFVHPEGRERGLLATGAGVALLVAGFRYAFA